MLEIRIAIGIGFAVIAPLSAGIGVYFAMVGAPIGCAWATALAVAAIVCGIINLRRNAAS